MDQNQVSVYAKKIREVVRALFFMLRKSKRKLFVELNFALKRSKLAGKSLIVKLAHHHSNHQPDYYSAAGVFNYPDPKSNDYVEFSCSNTPAHNTATTNHHTGAGFLLSHVILPSLHLINGKKNGQKARFETVQEEFIFEKAIERALNDVVSTSGSPVLPGFGFGRSPVPVRQLRVTDSPYPISGGGSEQVDAAADDFIKRFYSQLQKQPLTDG